ncbi:putative aromatic prenyltransferase [Colletotrichum sublineola]|uniref:Putative aromatic prenyltransferase n=1 Tax=Colletotrichum sublineola TaxID=1173701 RepID=A0A066X9S4_COLSU|nr:putative aromatic prenyltransferase [Colletotrichum sublineola]
MPVRTTSPLARTVVVPSSGFQHRRQKSGPSRDDGVIWYTFEPLCDTTGSADDSFAGEIRRSLIPILSQAPSDIDLQWYKQVMNEWFVTPEGAVAACQNMPPHVKRIPQLFLACDVKRSKRILKAYLFPALKHSVMGATTSDFVFDMISKLQSFGDKLVAPAGKLQK